jgi:hypothetical protein
MRRLIGFGLAVGGVALSLRVIRRQKAPLTVDEQVHKGLTNPVAGWWVRSVLDAFEYLITDFGYALHEVQMHFKGTYIVYRGPVFELVTGYDPEATHSINAELWVAADLGRRDGDAVARHPRAFDVNRLLGARDPSLRLPETMPARLDQAVVREAVAVWARGLRELAPDVLAGDWPTDIGAHRLW